jgi:hypothetical protein
MPKSKKRGGEKAHRRRVKLNTVNAKKQVEKAQKMFQDAMMEQIEAMRQAASGETENKETANETTGFVQSAENL